jgi:hypothetical protein
MFLRSSFRIFVYGVVQGCIVYSEELYGPGSGLTITPIEMVSKPSTPEAIEPLQKDQNTKANKLSYSSQP